MAYGKSDKTYLGVGYIFNGNWGDITKSSINVNPVTRLIIRPPQWAVFAVSPTTTRCATSLTRRCRPPRSAARPPRPAALTDVNATPGNHPGCPSRE